jgi:hypothetical protein
MISGIGIHKFELPWFFNPTGTIPYFIGHSGLSGALAFYSPKENIFITGTVNQVAHTDLSFRTMIKLAQMILKSVSPKHSQCISPGVESFCIVRFHNLELNKENLEAVLSESELIKTDTVSDNKFKNEIIIQLYLLKYKGVKMD